MKFIKFIHRICVTSILNNNHQIDYLKNDDQQSYQRQLDKIKLLGRPSWQHSRNRNR